MSNVNFRPFVRNESEPEQGQECVVLINGNSYGTAIWESTGYEDNFVNESYDYFESSMVTHFLPITEIPL